jgi:hypothetical protein
MKSPSARQYIRNAQNFYSGCLQFESRLGYILAEDVPNFLQPFEDSEIKCREIISHNSLRLNICHVYVPNMQNCI